MGEKNLRMHDRIDLARTIAIRFADGFSAVCQTKDISLTGMFIKGNLRQLPGTPCSVTLSERWSTVNCQLNFRAKVARNGDCGIALQYTEMEGTTYNLLQTLLLYGCNDPLSFGEEFARGCPFVIADNALTRPSGCQA